MEIANRPMKPYYRVLSTFTRYQGAIAMDFKQAGLSLLGGWIIGVVFMATKLPAPVPPLMGLIGAAGVLLGGYCYEIIARLLMKQ